MKRALLSVYDKTGITELSRALADLGWELISTGGTMAALNEAGIPVRSVTDVTGFPEILDGRVKTLHPQIHGGLLARMDIPDHVTSLAEHDIQPIELVVCNLYPFEVTVSKPGVDMVEAVEQIDIGGPAMIRAGAKNFHHVTVLVSPQDYEFFLGELTSEGVSLEQRKAYAARAFAHVSAYDAVVAEFLRGSDASFPTELTIAGRKQLDLRYGENPGQRAAAYYRIVAGHSLNGILTARQLHGKELSYNNVLDADAAWGALLRFERPGVAIVKHTIPCGLALHDQLDIAFDLAFAGDPVSAFGGIVALNRPVDVTTAQKIDAIFFEVVVAPGFEPDALALLQRKRQLRLLEMGAPTGDRDELAFRDIDGGFLVQEPDNQRDDPANWRSVAVREPTSDELRNLEFAWEACRYVKSNAIVLAANESVTGIGSGQPNRVESVRIAVAKAGSRSHSSVLASDAFFPFADGVEAAVEGGVTAIVQPGGSVRDDEVIAAANKGGVAMLFTGNRHFLH